MIFDKVQVYFRVWILIWIHNLKFRFPILEKKFGPLRIQNSIHNTAPDFSVANLFYVFAYD
jgi:hypothetical protein